MPCEADAMRARSCSDISAASSFIICSLHANTCPAAWTCCRNARGLASPPPRNPYSDRSRPSKRTLLHAKRGNLAGSAEKEVESARIREERVSLRCKARKLEGRQDLGERYGRERGALLVRPRQRPAQPGLLVSLGGVASPHDRRACVCSGCTERGGAGRRTAAR